MAATRADVRTIDALHDVRAALADFRTLASSALAEALGGADRVQQLLDADLPMQWKQAIRRAEGRVNHAKSELAKAEMQAMGSAMSVREQKKHVERAQEKKREAEQGLERTKRWAREWEREASMFRARLQALARVVEADLPREESRLSIMHERLVAYVKERPERTDGPARTDGGGEQVANPDDEENA